MRWLWSWPAGREHGDRPFFFDLQRLATERTEPATPRRRQEARRRGQVARTPELGVALALLSVVAVGAALAKHSVEVASRFTRYLLASGIPGGELQTATVQRLFLEAVGAALLIAGPWVVAATVVVFVGHWLQVGFLMTGEGLKLDWSRLNPVQGFRRIASIRSVAELVKAVVKVAIISYPVWRAVQQGLLLFPALLEMPITTAVSTAAGVVYRATLTVGLALLGLAALDYLYQRWETERSLRMTKQELREELRESEGDPRIRSRIRQRQRQLASSRMMQRVPSADVVITNPTHVAVALRYDPDRMLAPEVVAKGAGLLAQRIRAVAQAHGVRVVENPPLARALFEAVEVGQAIPPEFYRAVAEVLAFVYRWRRQRGRPQELAGS